MKKPYEPNGLVILCRKFLLLSCATVFAFPPSALGMLPAGHIDHRFDDTVRYSSKPFMLIEEGGALTTSPVAPTQTRSQSCGTYQGRPQPIRESFEGRDLRRLIETPDKWPYSVHGQLESFSARGNSFSGSGVLVGPQHFLTAAHCVYDQRMDGWAESLTVYPALNNRSAPFGAVRGTRAYLYREWVESENADFDIALIVLEKAIGNETGWAGMLGLAEEELREHKVHVTGYPGESLKRSQMWTMEDTLDRIDDETFSYKIHTSGGQSGGAIWINKWGSPFLLGVHTSAFGGRNFGVRLSRAKIQDLMGWMEGTGKIATSQTSVSLALSTSSSSTSSSSSAPRLDKDALLDQAQSGDRRSFADLMVLAEEDEDPWARYSLGKMYENKLGVKQDLQKALRWYRLAAAQGYNRAIIALERLEEEDSLSNQGRSGTSSSSSSVRPTAASSSGNASTQLPPAASTSTAVVQKVPRPLGDGIKIPEIARGYEDIYRRFVMGRLIYKPDPNSNEGRVELPIRDLANPLEGEFDLSRCGDSGRYLSINTGYRKGKKAANAEKVEIWLAPRFLIERELATTARHFQPIMAGWHAAIAPVGLFWTWGGWDKMEWYDYLTKNTLADLSDNNLYATCGDADTTRPIGIRSHDHLSASAFMFHL